MVKDISLSKNFGLFISVHEEDKTFTAMGYKKIEDKTELIGVNYGPIKFERIEQLTEEYILKVIEELKDE